MKREHMTACSLALGKAHLACELGAVDRAMLFIDEAQSYIEIPSRTPEQLEQDAANSKAYRERVKPDSQSPSPLTVGDRVVGVGVVEEVAKTTKKNGRAEGVQKCWDHWLTIRPTTRRKSLKTTAKEYKQTVARFDEGFSVNDIKSCLTGYTQSSHHRGENERNWVFDYLFAVRDGANVEKGIGHCEPVRQVTSVIQDPDEALTLAKKCNGCRPATDLFCNAHQRGRDAN